MRSNLSSLGLMQVLYQAPAGTGDASGINSTAVRPEIGVDWPEGGADLPAQMLGDFKTLMPAALSFLLPANVAQLWHRFEAEDKKPGSKTHGQKVERWQLKFDKANPLIVSSGPHAGQPLTGTIGSNPRPRGKKDDPKTPWVSDLAYLISVSLQDQRRPSSIDELKAIVNSYAGKEIRLQTGLSGQCRPDAVRRLYFEDPTDLTFAQEGRERKLIVLEDPAGTKGCGMRYYTKDFKNPSPTSLEDQYFTELQCDHETVNPLAGQPGQPATIQCNAVVRGWPSIDGFLPPLGAGSK